MKNREIHIWQKCHHCGMKPIVGARYHCVVCPESPDSDLCGDCFNLYNKNNLIHPAVGSGYSTSNLHQFISERGKPEQDYLPWLELLADGIPQNPLIVPNGFVVRPEFVCVERSYFGGHAFVVEINGKLLVVTALHVLDELIKACGIDCTTSSPNYSGTELPSLIKEVKLYDVLEHRWIFYELSKTSGMLALRNARIGEEEPNSSRDIAAFIVTASENLNPLPIAEKSPAVGDTIWLVARTDDHGFIHQATVVENTEQSFVFGYLDSKITFRATSGAPILNSHCEVVAINVGAGCYENNLLGHGMHVENIRQHLMELL